VCLVLLGAALRLPTLRMLNVGPHLSLIRPVV